MCNMLVKSKMVNEAYTNCLRMMSQYLGYASVVRAHDLHLERLTDSKLAEVSPNMAITSGNMLIHGDTWGAMGTSLSVSIGTSNWWIDD